MGFYLINAPFIEKMGLQNQYGWLNIRGMVVVKKKLILDSNGRRPGEGAGGG